MPKGIYRFEAATLPARLLSQNRPSTDALNAISKWAGNGKAREFGVLTDNDEFIRALLAWDDRDTISGEQLERYCAGYGVKKVFEAGPK